MVDPDVEHVLDGAHQQRRAALEDRLVELVLLGRVVTPLLSVYAGIVTRVSRGIEMFVVVPSASR